MNIERSKISAEERSPKIARAYRLPGGATPRNRCAHQYTYMRLLAAEPRSTAGLIPLSVSLWNHLAYPVFDGVGQAGFKSRANAFFISPSCSIPTIVCDYFSLSLLSVYRLVLWGRGLRTDGVYITLSQPCIANLF